MIMQHSGAWNLLVFWMKIVTNSRFQRTVRKGRFYFGYCKQPAQARWQQKKRAKSALAAPLFFISVNEVLLLADTEFGFH